MQVQHLSRDGAAAVQQSKAGLWDECFLGACCLEPVKGLSSNTKHLRDIKFFSASNSSIVIAGHLGIDSRISVRSDGFLGGVASRGPTMFARSGRSRKVGVALPRSSRSNYECAIDISLAGLTLFKATAERSILGVTGGK